jgi:hypothetical protein
VDWVITVLISVELPWSLSGIMSIESTVLCFAYDEPSMMNGRLFLFVKGESERRKEGWQSIWLL